MKAVAELFCLKNSRSGMIASLAPEVVESVGPGPDRFQLQPLPP